MNRRELLKSLAIGPVLAASAGECPSLALVAPRTLTPEQKAQFKAEWDRLYDGSVAARVEFYQATYGRLRRMAC